MGVLFLVMASETEGGYAARLVEEARLASALDLVETALGTPEFDPVVVATNSEDVARRAEELGATADVDKGPFHFGRRLLEIVESYKPRKLLYAGAGSAPLLPPSTLADIAARLDEEEGVVITNNLFSSDWAGFSPASTLTRVRLPDSDNDLAWRLYDEGGLTPHVLPISTATVLDIDTPAELGILKLHPGVGGRLGQFLKKAPLDTHRIEQVIQVLRKEEAFVFAAGRVPSYAWVRLERETMCRTRVLSEERGMRSSGRQRRGEVRSLLAYLVEALGVEGFFQRLAEMADAALIDTRVLMAHWRIWPAAEERFRSDLLMPEGISHPRLREFTLAAREAPIPVLLGGHSLVCGGIMALIDLADARPPHRAAFDRLSSGVVS